MNPVALAVVAVALLLGLVLVVRLHAFVALLLTSLVVAVLGGMPITEITSHVQQTMGATLGYIAERRRARTGRIGRWASPV